MGDVNSNVVTLTIKKAGILASGDKEEKIDLTFEEEKEITEKKGECRGIKYLLNCVKKGRVNYIDPEIIKALAIACWNHGRSKRINNEQEIEGYTADVRNVYGEFTNKLENQPYKQKINNLQKFFGECCLDGSKTGMLNNVGQRTSLLASNIDLTTKLSDLAKNNGITLTI